MVLGSTKPPTEINIVDISWCKGGRCVGLKALLPSCVDYLEIPGASIFESLRACPGLYRDRLFYNNYKSFVVNFKSLPFQINIFRRGG